ncbi:hypothetical protein [Actinacidiphila sp. ITFR-21]|uniref:hypothetical protein n=1 Tax=Actinacidiphila sp. ITFR-21 TaxID=3075199 RepID=UPI00288A26F7|nr:hypothetical protein [Streptomyces sp. ITFR-21]WNI14140.1 hypothetical protein RLT57_00425 [Streptomyces sp. ITFR-21]
MSLPPDAWHPGLPGRRRAPYAHPYRRPVPPAPERSARPAGAEDVGAAPRTGVVRASGGHWTGAAVRLGTSNR